MARKKKAKIAMTENTTNEDINVLGNTTDGITEDSTTTNNESTKNADTSNENISTIDNTEEDNTFDGVLLSNDESSIGEKTYIQSLKVNDIDVLKFNDQECERMYIDGEEVWASGISTEVEGSPVTLYEPLSNKRIQQCLIYGNRGGNMIPYPYHYTTRTINGVTFTDNGDGTITVNGTATANTTFFLVIPTSNPTIRLDVNKQYMLSGCPAGGTETTYLLLAYDDKYGYADKGEGFSFKPQTANIEVSIRVYEGATVENLIFKPQLEEGTTVSDFKTYKSVGDLGTKNLIPYPYIDVGLKNKNFVDRLGINFVDNGDGSVTTTGTATMAVALELCEFYPANGDIDMTKKYTVTAGENIPAQMFLSAVLYDEDSNYVSEMNTGASSRVLDLPTLSKGKTIKKIKVRILISKGIGDETPVTFKPQLEEGKIATDFNVNNGKYNIPMTIRGKNLIPYPYYNTTKTENGITFTDNGDGSITVNGTATADILFFYASVANYQILASTYTLSGCPKGGSSTTYCQVLGDSSFMDVGNGITRTYKQDVKQNIFIKIFSGTTVENLIFKPQLEKGEILTLYEKYISPSFTMVSLDTPLNPDEYIDVINKKRYNTNGDIIDIQVFNVLKTLLENGTNIIEANTEILPKNIKVIYRKGKTTSVKSGNPITINDAYRRGKRFISANIYGAANEVKVVPAIKDDSGNETTPAEVQVVGTGRKFINLNNKLNLFKGVDELIEIKADTYYTIQWQAPYNEQYKSIFLYDENKVLTNKIVNRAYLSSTYSNMVLKSSTAGFMRLFGDVDKNKGDVQVFVVEGLQGTLSTKQQEALDSTGISTSMTTCTLGTGDYIYQPYYTYNIPIRNSITDTTKTVGDNLLNYTIKYDAVGAGLSYSTVPTIFLKRGRYLLTLENLKNNTTGVSRLLFFPCDKNKNKYSYYNTNASGVFDRVMKIEKSDCYWNTNVFMLWEGQDKADERRAMQYVITIKEDLYLHIGLSQTSSDCIIEKAELKRIPCIDVDVNLNERLHDGEFIDLYNNRRYNKNKQLIEEDVDVVGELTSLPEDDENKIFYDYTDNINKVEVMYYKK